MKKFLIMILSLPLFLCAQEKNKLAVDEKSGKQIAIGICDRTVFADTNFSWWYDSEYNNYEAAVQTLDSIKSKLENVSIAIVMGTWCSDSRKQVPAFLRILDELKFEPDKLTLICVDRKKEAEGTRAKDLDIKLVPTLIIYKDEHEIGRIVETPRTTLESDMKNILYDGK
ncbi:MAG: thioredoxin family protein [Ignavibacteriales bacterium]|nr:thioredoxin family protein [Ignavibacteriales bacterium]